MNLFINGSNREKNNYNILKDIMISDDELISLSKKDIKYCLGCSACINKLDNYCVLNDFVTNNIYPKIRQADRIILSSPLYMSNITGLLKTVIDRFNPFYNHDYLNGKEIYLILTGQGSYEANEEEINDIIKYFKGISEWMNFKFEFLNYFTSGDLKNVDNVKLAQSNYEEMIQNIKRRLI